jgi:AcrR family transcriptional regulator
MTSFENKITIKVNEHVYLKSPETSELGQKIIQGSVELIDDLGFENFNFKKLAKHISSTEASIYRYFESKHQLLVYLVIWYWGWQEYRLVMRLTNVEDPLERLERAVKVITEEIQEDSTFSQINEIKLNRIVITESSKIFLNKNVDQDNKLGFFSQYKEVIQLVANIILEINPTFPYPHMLVSTIVEGAHHQRFFAKHLPKLTDSLKGKDTVTTFYHELILNQIKHNAK